ncbi:MAG: hypothetical protein WCW17_02510 [Patescibacteria group bacterium]
MYEYKKPTPIIIKLTDEEGIRLRQQACDYISSNQNKKGAERGSKDQQGFGALAEMVIRNQLGMAEINDSTHPLSYDILLSGKIKADVKCRGGALPFKEEYIGGDGFPREAKHNLFARQIFDENLDTDIYIMTHLEHPKNSELPGTKRQKKWILYICGWVSKERAKNEGVFLPRGSLTEQGNKWFPYRGQEIEYYHKNLNGLEKIVDLLKIDEADVQKDRNKIGDLNLTSVDALRITFDLVGRGILDKKYIDFIKSITNLSETVRPILHINQYFHLLKWLEEKNQIGVDESKKLSKIIEEIPYSGI